MYDSQLAANHFTMKTVNSQDLIAELTLPEIKEQIIQLQKQLTFLEKVKIVCRRISIMHSVTMFCIVYNNRERQRKEIVCLATHSLRRSCFLEQLTVKTKNISVMN